MKSSLLVHAGALGDFILSLRVVQAMRQGGKRRVVVLGRPSIASIAVPDGGVDGVLDIDTGGYHALFSADLELPAHVRRELAAFDVAVDMLGGDDGRLARRLLDAGIQLVMRIDPRPQPGLREHVTEQWLHNFRCWGGARNVGPPSLRVAPSELREARRTIADVFPRARKADVILHPGSGSPRKCWPLHHFTELASRLARSRRRVLFLTGPVEEERFSQHEFQALFDAGELVECWKLPHLARLVAAVGTYVGNDAGPTHLAAALGARTIAIFGPTDPRVWGPMGPRARVLQGENGSWPTVDAVAGALSACWRERPSRGAECSPMPEDR
jgi:ADP-heptose:LPS heptosyltransferase